MTRLSALQGPRVSVAASRYGEPQRGRPNWSAAITAPLYAILYKDGMTV
jgi:hypothetical protein